MDIFVYSSGPFGRPFFIWGGGGGGGVVLQNPENPSWLRPCSLWPNRHVVQFTPLSHPRSIIPGSATARVTIDPAQIRAGGAVWV